MYVQFIIIRLFSFSHYRTPWPERPQARRGPAEQGDQLAEGSRDVQPGGAEEAAVLHAHPRQAAGAEVALRPGHAEDILPQAGGPRAGAAAHREDVRVEYTLLGGPHHNRFSFSFFCYVHQKQERFTEQD